MQVIDLNARRAARAEQEREPYTVQLGGDTFTLPHYLDWPEAAIEHMYNDDLLPMFRVLFGDQWQQFSAHGLVLGDLQDLFRGIMQATAVGEAGKSPTSNSSSTNGSTPSKPTFEGSTPTSPTSAPSSARGRNGARRGSSPT